MQPICCLHACTGQLTEMSRQYALCSRMHVMGACAWPPSCTHMPVVIARLYESHRGEDRVQTRYGMTVSRSGHTRSQSQCCNRLTCIAKMPAVMSTGQRDRCPNAAVFSIAMLHSCLDSYIACVLSFVARARNDPNFSDSISQMLQKGLSTSDRADFRSCRKYATVHESL